MKVTWNRLHDVVHSGKIFIIKHGNRWILNYDELLDLLLNDQSSHGDNVKILHPILHPCVKACMQNCTRFAPET